MSTLRRVLPFAAVALSGVLFGVLLFAGGDDDAPSLPTVAPASDQTPPPASRIPGQVAPPTPRSSNDLRAQGQARSASDSAPVMPQPTPQELERWQAEEPVALHAVRDADRWREVAAELPDQALPELVLQAESIAMRLDRALSPRPQDETTALLIEEIELIRTIVRAGVDDALLVQLQSIEQGAHHAIQGAPPPEVLEAQREAAQER